jgi:hypothetical protein
MRRSTDFIVVALARQRLWRPDFTAFVRSRFDVGAGNFAPLSLVDIPNYLSTMNQHRSAALAKFASTATLPLVLVWDDGALCIRFQEGGVAKLRGGARRSSHSIFCLAVWGSLHLDGQPVRCTGVVPGVSLRVATRAIKLSDIDPGDLASDIWRALRGRLAEWVASGSAGPRRFGMSSGDGIEVELGWDSEVTLRPGAMQIEVEYAEAFEQAYIASRAHRPLIELSPGESEPPITVETSARAGLIRRAMNATILI